MLRRTVITSLNSAWSSPLQHRSATKGLTNFISPRTSFNAIKSFSAQLSSSSGDIRVVVAEDLNKILNQFPKLGRVGSITTTDREILRIRSCDLLKTLKVWNSTGVVIPSAMIDLYLHSLIELESTSSDVINHESNVLSTTTRDKICAVLKLAQDNWKISSIPMASDSDSESESVQPSRKKRSKNVLMSPGAVGFIDQGAVSSFYPFLYTSPLQKIVENLARKCLDYGYVSDTIAYCQANGRPAIDGRESMSFLQNLHDANSSSTLPIEKFNLHTLIEQLPPSSSTAVLTSFSSQHVIPTVERIGYIRDLMSVLETLGILPNTHCSYFSRLFPATRATENPWQISHADLRLLYTLEYTNLVLCKYADDLGWVNTDLLRGGGGGVESARNGTAGLTAMVTHCRDVDSGLNKALKMLTTGKSTSTSSSGHGSYVHMLTLEAALQYYSLRWRLTAATRILAAVGGEATRALGPSMDTVDKQFQEWYDLHWLAGRPSGGNSGGAGASTLTELQMLHGDGSASVVDLNILAAQSVARLVAASSSGDADNAGVEGADSRGSGTCGEDCPEHHPLWQRFRVHALAPRDVTGTLTSDPIFNQYWHAYLVLHSHAGNASAVLASAAQAHQAQYLEPSALGNLLADVLSFYRPLQGGMSVDAFSGELKQFLQVKCDEIPNQTLFVKPWREATKHSMGVYCSEGGTKPLFVSRITPGFTAVRAKLSLGAVKGAALGSQSHSEVTNGNGWIGLMISFLQNEAPVGGSFSASAAATRELLSSKDAAPLILDKCGVDAAVDIVSLLHTYLMQWLSVSASESTVLLGFIDGLVEHAALRYTTAAAEIPAKIGASKREMKTPIEPTIGLAELLSGYLDIHLSAFKLDQAYMRAGTVGSVNNIHDSATGAGSSLYGCLARTEGLLGAYLAVQPKQTEALLCVHDLAIKRFEVACVCGGGGGVDVASTPTSTSVGLSRGMSMFQYLNKLGSSYVYSLYKGKSTARGSVGVDRFLPTVADLRQSLCVGGDGLSASAYQRPLFAPLHYVMLCDHLLSSWPANAAQVALLEDPHPVCSEIIGEFHLSYPLSRGSSASSVNSHTSAAEKLLCGCVGLFGKAAQMNSNPSTKKLLISQAVLFINEHTHSATGGVNQDNSSEFSVVLSNSVIASFIKICCSNGLLADALEHCADPASIFTAARAVGVSGKNNASNSGGWSSATGSDGGTDHSAAPLQGLSKRMRKRAEALGLGQGENELTPSRPTKTNTNTNTNTKQKQNSSSADIKHVGDIADVYEPIFFAFALQKLRANTQLFSDYHIYTQMQHRIRREARERARQEEGARFDDDYYYDDDGSGDDEWGEKEIPTAESVYQGLINRGAPMTSRSIESLVLGNFYDGIRAELLNERWHSSSVDGNFGDDDNNVFDSGMFDATPGEIVDRIVSLYHVHHRINNSPSSYGDATRGPPRTESLRSLADREKYSALPRIPLFLALLDYFLIKGDENEVRRMLDLVYPLYKEEYSLDTINTNTNTNTSSVNSSGSRKLCLDSSADVDWNEVEFQMKVELLSKENVNARLGWYGQDSFL